MSLVQRVTSIEGTDREQPSQLDTSFPGPASGGYGTIKPSYHLQHQSSYQKSLRHVLSYDAFAKPEGPSQATNPTGGVTAYKVSPTRRFAQVCFTVLACWLASGIVFGFAALKPVLIDQGVYRELCSATEIEDDVEVCYKQDLRLNLFFAIASTTCNISALPVGTILDHYGPRMTAILGAISLAIGSILMACAFAIPEFDGYIVGNVFLAIGGTFIFVPSFAIANAFPRFAGSIVAVVTGAFDASAAVFLLYRLVYEQTESAFTSQKFFLCYLAVPVLILGAQFTLMNEDSYKTGPQMEVKIEKELDATRDVHDSDEELNDSDILRLRNERRDRRESKLEELEHLLGDAEERQQRAEKEENRLVTSGVWGVLHGKSAMEQIFSLWFVLITLLTVLQMLRMNFFIATIRAQYEAMLESEELGRRINSFFDVALPIGGVVATPFIGLLLDNVSTAAMLAILVSMITAVGIVGSLPFLWAGYCNIIIFVMLRPLYYSAMSDYAAKVFGFATFGRVYGCIIALSGIVNLSQPLIDAMNHEVFEDNPIPINVFLASLGFTFGTSLVIYVWTKSSRVDEKLDSQEYVWDRFRMIPEEDEITELEI